MRGLYGIPLFLLAVFHPRIFPNDTIQGVITSSTVNLVSQLRFIITPSGPLLCYKTGVGGQLVSTTASPALCLANHLLRLTSSFVITRSINFATRFKTNQDDKTAKFLRQAPGHLPYLRCEDSRKMTVQVGFCNLPLKGDFLEGYLKPP